MKSFFISIRRHKILTFFVIILIVIVSFVANGAYSDQMDRENTEKLVQRMTVIYEKLQTVDSNGWRFYKACTQPEGGFFPTGKPSCGVDLRHIDSLQSIDEVRDKIDANYTILKANPDLTTVKLEHTNDIYPSFDQGFTIAADEDATGGAMLDMDGIKNVDFCEVEYVLTNKDRLSEGSRTSTKDPAADYFLLSLIRCSVQTNKLYYSSRGLSSP